MPAEDHREPLSRARRFRSCGMRMSRRDSSIAGNSMRTVLESNSGKIENEMVPLERIDLLFVQNQT